MLETVVALVKAHPALLLLIVVTWLLAQAITALVGAIPAPTKDSSARYVFWFKAANLFVGNILRAYHNALERSPNWQDAVAKHLAEQNGAQQQGVVTDWQQPPKPPQ